MIGDFHNTFLQSINKFLFFFFHTIGDTVNFWIFILATYFRETQVFFFHVTTGWIFCFSFRVTYWKISWCFPLTKFTISPPPWLADKFRDFFSRDWLWNFMLFFVTDWQILLFHLATDWQNSWCFSWCSLCYLLFLNLAKFFINRQVYIYLFIC